jgi:hypothetical protein
MQKFLPLPNVSITCATCAKQAEQIVDFLSRHASDLPCGSFYIRDECVICVTSIKESQIAYIQGVIVGFLLSK